MIYSPSIQKAIIKSAKKSKLKKGVEKSDIIDKPKNKVVKKGYKWVEGFIPRDIDEPGPLTEEEKNLEKYSNCVLIERDGC